MDGRPQPAGDVDRLVLDIGQKATICCKNTYFYSFIISGANCYFQNKSFQRGFV